MNQKDVDTSLGGADDPKDFCIPDPELCRSCDKSDHILRSAANQPNHIAAIKKGRIKGPVIENPHFVKIILDMNRRNKCDMNSD
jgi:hypothetical protein